MIKFKEGMKIIYTYIAEDRRPLACEIFTVVRNSAGDLRAVSSTNGLHWKFPLKSVNAHKVKVYTPIELGGE